MKNKSIKDCAKLFRISQTEEKLRKDSIQGADAATSVHYNVGKEVRTAIEKSDERRRRICQNRRKVFKRLREQMARLKAKAKKGTIMLYE